MPLDSLWMMCLLLFLEGGTLAFLTTPTLLYYGKLHGPWTVAFAGGASSALGSALQMLILRWAMATGRPWMKRFTPSREKLEAALKSYPSATFLALVTARATPLPDAPLKIVAAVVEYPVLLYAIAVFIGSIPYYYLLARLGRHFVIPNWILAAAGLVLAIGITWDWWRKRHRAQG